MKVEIRTKALKNGNKSLYLDIYEKGKRRYEYLRLYIVPETDDNAKRINENAMKKAREMCSKVILGKKIKKTNCKEDKSITLMEWIERYEQNIIGNRSVSKSTKAQTNMVKRIMQSYLVHIKKQNLKLTDFGKNELTGFFTYMKTKYKGIKGKGLSENTMATYQQRIVAVLNEAMRNELIMQNPIVRLRDKERIGKPHTSKGYLTIDEVKRIASVRHHLHDEVRTAFLFSCFTGLRISDIYTITWDDIVETDKGKVIIKEQKKTHAQVFIPLCNTAQALLPQKEECDNHVFHLPSKSCVEHVLKEIEGLAGIDHHFTYHNSRHTFGTLTMETSKDLNTVSKLLGHRDIRNTVRYADNTMDSKVKSVSLMNGLFN